jgi:hypothetical protein
MKFKSDVTAESQLILQRYVNANYDGTLIDILGVDSLGNVIKQQASDFVTVEERGSFQETSDSNGQLTFNHNLGAIPTHIILTCRDATVASIISETSTQITILVSARSTSITGYYIIS